MREVSACWSASWKEAGPGPGGRRRARAMESWTVLPVWKPAQTKVVEYDTASLWGEEGVVEGEGKQE